jgi:uncharacterized membrane protein
MFGEQPYYPRQEAAMANVLTYQETTGLPGDDLWAARNFRGNKVLGFKVALCERDVAIYVGILLFGLIFGISHQRLKGFPWYIWVPLGILPIALDGLSQLLSQPPLSPLPFRESTPMLRIITGWMFGFFTAWYGYPIAEASMRTAALPAWQAATDQ